MPETIVVPSTVVPASVPVAEPVKVPEPDLITKVTQFKKQPAPVQSNASSPDNLDMGFDYKEIESIQDPIAKEVAIKAYKSMQSGFTKKSMDIAQQRKDLEAKLSDMNKWTPSRIQELLNNQEFLQAAQQVTGNQNQNTGLTDEEFSTLTDKEKTEILQLKSTVNELKQKEFQSVIHQTDTQLKSRYPDYDPIMVDEGIARLSRMSPNEIREYVYKAINHEEHMRNAYEVGRSDREKLNQEKVNASTIDGTSAVNSDDMPGVNKKNFLEIAQYRLSQFKKR